MQIKREITDDSLATALSATPDCAPIEQLAGLAAGELPASDALRIRSHAVSCPRCRAELMLAETFLEPAPTGREEPEVDRIVQAVANSMVPPLTANAESGTQQSATRSTTGADRDGSATWRPLWRWAAVLLAVAGGLWSYQSVRSTSPQLDLPSSPSIVRGSNVETISPVGRLAQAPAELRWVQVAEAQSYRVEISRVDRSSVWSVVVEEPQAELPQDVAAGLRRATRYNWQVTAIGLEDRVVASSASVGFIIENKSSRQAP